MPSLLNDEANTPGDTDQSDFWSSIVNPDWQKGPVFTDEQLAVVRNDPQMWSMGLGDLTQPLHEYLAGFGLVPGYTNLGVRQGNAAAPNSDLSGSGDPQSGGLNTPAVFKPGAHQDGFQNSVVSASSAPAAVAPRPDTGGQGAPTGDALAPDADGQDAPSDPNPAATQPRLVQPIPDDQISQRVPSLDLQNLLPVSITSRPSANSGRPAGAPGVAGVSPSGDAAPATKICTVDDARVLTNNLPTRAPSRAGAYGVPETAGSGVVASDQWASGTNAQKTAQIRPFRNQVSGWAPDGKGGYQQIFNGISDNLGGKDGARADLEAKYPQSVLIELPGGVAPDHIKGLQLRGVPLYAACPVPGLPPVRAGTR